MTNKIPYFKGFLVNACLFGTRILTVTGLSMLLLFGLGITKAEAATPSYSVYTTTSNLVQITVQGDPNATIQLYYYQYGSNALVGPTTIGTTNSSGYFSTSVAQNAYGIVGGATTYVTVNGQQSSNTVWPNIYSSGSNVYLSQPNVYLSAGQSTTVNVYGGNNSYSISSNTNPGIASVTINGNSLNVYGVGQGNTTISICSSGTYSNCATLIVNVTGSTYYGSGPISVSQSSVFMYQGQSQTVYINGGGGYYISNNPNTSVATASISGNTLNIYGVNPGSVSYSICSSGGSYSCVAVYVNVSAYYYNYNSSYTYPYYNNNYYPNNYNNGFYNSTYYNSYPNNYSSYAYPTTYTSVYPTTYASTYPTTYTSTQTGTPVSGVFLNQIPATGISFGLKMALFATGLILWSLFGAYVVYKKYPQLGIQTVGSNTKGNLESLGIHDKALAFKMNQQRKKGIE